MHRYFLALLCVSTSAWAQPKPASVAASAAKAPAAPAKPPPPPVKPIPRSHGLLDLGKSSFTLLFECQKEGWAFFARAGEKIVSRRGITYAVTAANVFPPEKNEVNRYRLTFLDGRLAGMRIEFRAPNAARFGGARDDYGTPAWESSDRAEWISADRATSITVLKDGSQQEVVDMGLMRDRGYMTDEEIKAELGRRKARAQPPPAPPPPKPGPAQPGPAPKK
jgi:hypothetical protein